MKTKTNSYEAFLDSLDTATEPALESAAKEIVKHFQPSTPVSSKFVPATYLLDFSTKKYLYVEESCFNVLGYTKQWFLETGVETFITKWHPVDFDLINRVIFPENIAFLKTIPKGVYQDYIFTCNYRVQCPTGDYRTVLQRSSYIPGKDKTPAGVIGVALDISHYKSDLSIIHTIEKVEKTCDGLAHHLVYKKTHPVYPNQEQKLTRRENDIIKLLAEGYNSKEIASKLYLSLYTVNNHRKNILNKTGCKCSTALINYAIKNGLVS